MTESDKSYDEIRGIIIFTFFFGCYHYSLIWLIELYLRGGIDFLERIFHLIIGPRIMESIRDSTLRKKESRKAIHELAQDCISYSTSIFLFVAYTYSAIGLRENVDIRLQGTTTLSHFTLQTHVACTIYELVRLLILPSLSMHLVKASVYFLSPWYAFCEIGALFHLWKRSSHDFSSFCGNCS